MRKLSVYLGSKRSTAELHPLVASKCSQAYSMTLSYPGHQGQAFRQAQDRPEDGGCLRNAQGERVDDLASHS